MRSLSVALLAMLANSQAFTTLSPSHMKGHLSPLQIDLNKKSSKIHMSTAEKSEIGAPGTADLPWSELGFEFRPTKSHLRMIYKNGKWGEEELVEVS